MAYKLVVLGSCGVGKSALIIRFLQNRFVAEYEPTFRDFYEGQLMVDGEPCQLTILDTSGGQEYQDLQDDCILWGQGFLFVYTVDCIRSFVDMSRFWDQLKRVKGTSRVPMVLVANMVDEPHWMVDSGMGLEAAKSFGVPFVETSAKTRQGVDQAFRALVREIRTQAEEDQGCGLQYCSVM